jgi:hypothetical protein
MFGSDAQIAIFSVVVVAYARHNQSGAAAWLHVTAVAAWQLIGVLGILGIPSSEALLFSQGLVLMIPSVGPTLEYSHYHHAPPSSAS